MGASDGEGALKRLADTIARRSRERPAGSYTTFLLDGGVERIGAKVSEEAAEAVEAAAEEGPAGRAHLVAEAADLVYHLLVLLASRDASLSDVETELARREGVSGLEEKEGRGKGEG